MIFLIVLWKGDCALFVVQKEEILFSYRVNMLVVVLNAEVKLNTDLSLVPFAKHQLMIY